MLVDPLSLVFFLSLVILFFTFPGVWIYQHIISNNLSLEDLAIATVIGFGFFTLLGYLLLFVKAPWLLVAVALLLDLLVVKKIKLASWVLNRTQLILLVLVFIFGVTGQLLIIAPSGQVINDNMVFWSAHGRDGVWHLALIEQLKNGFPLFNPDFAGVRLVNYHFFSDIPSAIFGQIFSFNSRDLYFRFFPLLFSLLLGILSFSFGKKIGGTFWAGLWATIFTFFAGSFGYVVTLFRSGQIGGEILFWASQVQSSSGNPPQLIAFIVTLTLLLLFDRLLNHPNKWLYLIFIVLTGTLAEFKIYGAVIFISGLLITSLWPAVKNRQFSLLIATILGGSLMAALYLPNTSGSPTLLILQPWWLVRTMIVASDKLDWIDLEHKRQTYLVHHNYLRVAQLEIEALVIFLVGNLGMRVIGFWQVTKFKRLFNNYQNFFLLLILLVSLILPLLFIQKGIPANTIQFFQYFLLIFGILAGVSTAQILAKSSLRWLSVVITIVIILLSIPTQIGLLQVFYSRPPFAQISQPELIALSFLHQNSKPNDIILTPPFHPGQILGPSPLIWIWSDTSYVPAFSNRQAFVTDIEQLDIMGYDYKPRQNIQQQIFTTLDSNQFESSLKQNNIKFVYFPKPQRPKIDLTKTNLQNILTNSEVEIWKVN